MTRLSSSLLLLMPSPWTSSSGISLGAAQTQGDCSLTKIQQNPFVHKPTYTVAVHAFHGLDQSVQETRSVFSEYLTATAGQKFDPPIQFNVVAHHFTDLITAIENDDVDFLYSNPGVYSCIGTAIGATALATVVKSTLVRNRRFDLDVYGGVIAVRHDNDEINTLVDLKDKIIGAGGIMDLMGGQMQIYEMARAGMTYVNDPKQVVFTQNQYDVVRGVLDRTFDVGFIRTNQIEVTTDESGELVDPDLFKILDSKTFVMESGEIFPFLHSTSIHPQWPFSALPSVAFDVQRAVQAALMDFGEYAASGKQLECITNIEGKNDSKWCSEFATAATTHSAPCNATELALVAAAASRISHMSSFRTAQSYFKLRSIQEETGFLIQDSNGWRCTTPDNLYTGITCPQGYFKRNQIEFKNGCKKIGLPCDQNEEYDCFCKPCVKTFEVDVYHLVDWTNDPHLKESYEDSLPRCEKMEICGTIKQRESITMRIFDNLLRDGAEVTVTVHAGEDRKNLLPFNIPETYAYEFTITDNEARVQVVEVYVNGEPISQSPIRVMVVDADCKAKYGEASNRAPDSEGNCVCAGNTYEMVGSCLVSASFFMIIFSVVFVAIGMMLFIYLSYKKKQSDSVWHINIEELHFNEPPEVVGAGGFGVVILGQYRGTKVAVKRVLPPSKLAKGHSGSITSGENNGVGSTDIAVGTSNSVGAKTKSVKTSTGAKHRVKFGDATNSCDIESQPLSKTSQSGSNKDWERFMIMHHSDNDILRILESATSSDHGSGSIFERSASKSVLVLRYLPMWLRFDSHSRRVTDFVNEMRMLSRLRHPCITTVMGAVVTSAMDPMLGKCTTQNSSMFVCFTLSRAHPYILIITVMEYMEYGSLHDLLHNETMTPGGEIILQVVRDIVQGIQFLHASKPPILHGDLKAKNILVDSRFRAKVADFGFSHFKCTKQRNVLRGTPFYMAPEYLRRRSEYTTACDIYSLSMIIYEIYARAGPFEGEDPRKILPKVCHPRHNKRPPIPDTCPPKMADLMKKCWSANALFRPTAKDIDYVLVEMNSRDTEPLETATERIRDALKRKPTSIYDVFPKHIADALNAGKKVEAESHEIVTVVFSDIVGFTSISHQFTPLQVSTMLDRLYQAFDQLAGTHNIFKVETIGDAYMGVTNLDGSEYDTHVKQAAEYAQDAIRAASQILIDEEDLSKGYVQIRVGLHSGPVVSNVIGSLNPRYGLFGDTVNTASRMESNSMPGKIHCSHASAQLLQAQAPDIPLTLRGMIKIKGKGRMKTFWVGEDDLINMPPSTLLVPQYMDPLSERTEDDLIHDEIHADLSNHGSEPCTLDTVPCEFPLKSVHDHFIKVHTGQESNPTKIRMDGSLEKVREEMKC